MPSRALRASAGPIVRGSLLGSLLGTLPGGGSILAAFSSYTLEKRLSRHPERFGKGAIEGVAGPESANNAGAQTSFIPLLTLGIPSHPLMALMIGALMIQGITPGPNVVNERPALFWGVIASMWIGNAMLIILNLPLVGLWVAMLKSLSGAAARDRGVLDGRRVHGQQQRPRGLLAAFGLVGYLFSKLGCEPAPFLMGFVLGALLEEHLRRALVFSSGSPMVFVTEPISAGLLAVGAGAGPRRASGDHAAAAENLRRGGWKVARSSRNVVAFDRADASREVELKNRALVGSR